MEDSDIQYWQATIKMCDEAMKPRAEKWQSLRQGLGMDFDTPGVASPIRIPRMYKIAREIVASVFFRHPYLYIKATDDPTDSETEEILKDASPILENFANDALELMGCKEKIRQVGLDALFCFRGWLKFGFNPPGGAYAPYVGSDTMIEDFPCVEWVRPEHVLTDPLVQPHDFYTSRFVIHKMFPSLDDVIADPRFQNFEVQLKGLRGKNTSPSQSPFMTIEDDASIKDDVQRRVLQEAHRLANTRCMYEIHDRVKQKRYVFIDGKEQPIEEIEHPFLASVVESFPDPATGEPVRRVVDQKLQAEGVKGRKKFLVTGGLPFMTLSFDVSDQFYGDPIMAYENPIQQAITKIVSRQMDLLERFRRHPRIKRTEVEAHPEIVEILRTGADGQFIPLDDIEALQPELEWGTPPPGAEQLQNNLLGFEAQTIRTTVGGSNPATATETAIIASESELNRSFMQGAVERLYTDIITNVFSVLSDDQFSLDDHPLRVDPLNENNMTTISLKAWMLRGKYKIDIAVGSSNILYEALQKDNTIQMAQLLRQSSNVDQLEIDKSIARAFGESNPDRLMKPDANTDAAKAAELENQMFLSMQHDPGVTPGEDHQTHIPLQAPEVIAQHPQFSQLPPFIQSRVKQLATDHTQAHQQAMQQEAGGLVKGKARGNGRALGPPDNLLSQVQSAAQITQDVVSKQAERKMGR